MKTKHIADSILNGITINDELILELYEAKELRRLARINHLGIVHFLYPMAKHYRFEHSLGVYELTRRMLEVLKPNVSRTIFRSILAAALLHDVGHGPFSHLFELISPISHEKYSEMIINDQNTEIFQAFEKHEPGAREIVIKILQGKFELMWCNQIVSSEVDMDRLDYLLRDSTSTGAAYGQIDWRWLIKNARIEENKLVFKEKALTVVESLLLGRYHMNIAVYWNPKNVANQLLYKGWFNRMSYLSKNNLLKGKYFYLEKIFLGKKMNVQDFLNVDDSIVNSAIRYSTLEDDEIIRDIAKKFLKQQQPQTVFGNKNIEEFEKRQDINLKGQTWDIIDIPTNFSAYQKQSVFPSLILTNDGKIVKAVEFSSVINTKPGEEKRIKKLGVKI